MPVSGEARAAPERAALGRRVTALLFGRNATIVLALAALGLGVATFAILSGGTPYGRSTGQAVGLILANLAVLLLLAASLTTQIVRMWMERRRGSAGSRLHVRLVLLFGVVAGAPAVLVAGFSAVLFNVGIQSWFSDRVRDTLERSLIASRAYLEENRNSIRVDALTMAVEMNRAGREYLPNDVDGFARVLETYANLRGLTEAIIFEPVLGRVLAQAGLAAGAVVSTPPSQIMEVVRSGDVAVLPAEENGRVIALVALDLQPELLLLITRPLDEGVVEHMRATELAFHEYDQLDRNRGSLQVTFYVIFAIAVLLVLLAAVLVGLVMANQIARPISRLITAAERVRGGDLQTRLEEGRADDEIASLIRAFNRMTSQLGAQRGELMEAYRQIDERRRFTETVLSGVSAGVVGLDAEGRVNLPNRSASALLGLDLDAAIGLPIERVAPEFAPLLDAIRQQPERAQMEEIRIGPPNARRTLLARLGAELQGNGDARSVVGYVLTFDDITELLSAQRKAAWADIARRIAHEIKNPLTPIQLSAERLKRKYLKEISSDPETFRQCTDTIVRQVGDIGRMVDEFSAFARMPQPVIKPEDLGAVAHDALVLQRNAHAEIAYETVFPESPLLAPCDRRLIGQALTNLLQNAADAISMRERPGDEAPGGHILLAIETGDDTARIVVEDDGIGLPQGEARERLAEPYVTHKTKGTGLGLAIVKKIMEDHGGRLVLEDRAAGPGARAVLVLPLKTDGVREQEAGAEQVQRIAHGA